MMPFWLVSVLFLHLFRETMAIPSLVTRMIPHPHTQSPDFSHSDFSLAQLMQLQAQLHNNMLDTLVFHSSFPLYFIEIELPQADIKNGSVSLRVALDTGSSLFWVGCYTPGRKYKPYVSPSYREALDCRDSHPPLICSDQSTGCLCKQAYHGNQSVYSRLSYERVSIKSVIHRGSGISFPDIQFACALRVENFDPDFNQQFDGMLGLGLNPISLLSQIEASEFSYCIGEEEPETVIGDVFMIGPNEYVDSFMPRDLESTAFFESSYHYQVTLVGITFGNTWINLDISEGGDTLFDLGSSLSSLQPFAYNALFSHISDWMQQRLFLPGPPDGKRICYFGTLNELKGIFPYISLHFAGPTVLVLDERNLFMEVKSFGRICLNLIHPIYLNTSFNLIGHTFQKNHLMRYDLVNKRIQMQTTFCPEIFEDSSDDYINS